MSVDKANVFPAQGFFSSLFGWTSARVGDARLEDLFDAWVFAAHDAKVALDAWVSSLIGERAEAHAVYRAALDREERAAVVLAAAASS